MVSIVAGLTVEKLSTVGNKPDFTSRFEQTVKRNAKEAKKR